MLSFEVSVPAGQLNVGLCACSGQVFRWTPQVDGAWFGWDGEIWYRASIPTLTLHRESGEGVERFCVDSNGDRSAFERYFRLDWDAAAIETEILRRGPELEPHLRELRGLRLLRPACTAEAFYGFLCTPNNNLRRITKMVGWLAERGSGFPGSEAIASIDELELRTAGFGYRAATIPGAAREVVTRGGDAYIESLKNLPYAQVHAELLTIKGIGPKLADCICLFALDHTEAVPVDTHIWQAATRLFFPQWRDLSLTGARYQAIGDAMRDRFGKLAGWAQQFLFYENLLNWRSRN